MFGNKDWCEPFSSSLLFWNLAGHTSFPISTYTVMFVELNLWCVMFYNRNGTARMDNDVWI